MKVDSLHLQPYGDLNLGFVIPGGETEVQVRSRLTGVTQKSVSSHSVTGCPSTIPHHLFQEAFLAWPSWQLSPVSRIGQVLATQFLGSVSIPHAQDVCGVCDYGIIVVAGLSLPFAQPHASSPGSLLVSWHIDPFLPPSPSLQDKHDFSCLGPAHVWDGPGLNFVISDQARHPEPHGPRACRTGPGPVPPAAEGPRVSS